MGSEDKSMEFRILEAAEKLFLKQGFAKTSTGQIAKSAGCNQALVHYYYRTKDNLFEKIFEEKVRMVVANISASESAEGTIEEKVGKMVGLYFDFLKQNPLLPLFLLNEVSSNPDRLHSLIDKVQQYPKPILARLDAELRKEVEKGNIRPISGVNLLITIVSLNATPFLLKSPLQAALNLSDEDMDQISEQRKNEAIETVLSRLRK